MAINTYVAQNEQHRQFALIQPIGRTDSGRVVIEATDKRVVHVHNGMCGEPTRLSVESPQRTQDPWENRAQERPGKRRGSASDREQRSQSERIFGDLRRYQRWDTDIYSLLVLCFCFFGVFRCFVMSTWTL